MPLVHACRRRWCPDYAVPGGRGYCPAHQPAPWAGSTPMGPGWPAARAAALDRDGHRCTRCGAPATEVHHLRARADGGTDDPHNLTSLCGPCHHQAGEEQRRARQQGP